MNWFGATAEAAHAEITATLSGHTVSAAMTRRLEAVGLDDSLGTAARLSTATGQAVLPVVSGGRAVGALGQQDLLRGLASAGPGGAVAAFMSQDLPVVQPAASLVNAFKTLQDGGSTCLLVEEEGGHLAGVLTRSGVSMFLSLTAALAGQGPAGESKGAGASTKGPSSEPLALQRWADDGGCALTALAGADAALELPRAGDGAGPAGARRG